MFDKLEDLLVRYQEIMNTLNEPGVADDQNRFRKLMKDQAELAPIVEAYQEYKKAKQDIEDSLMILDEESDEEMRELAKEELNDVSGYLIGLSNSMSTPYNCCASAEELRAVREWQSEIKRLLDID